MPYKKGESGNPGGKPKVEQEFKAEAQKHWKKALQVLLDELESGDGRNRVLAAKEILDRGFGKPGQAATLEVSGKDGGPLIAVIKDA